VIARVRSVAVRCVGSRVECDRALIRRRRRPRDRKGFGRRRRAVFDELDRRISGATTRAFQTAVIAKHELRRPRREIARLTVDWIAVQPRGDLKPIGPCAGIRDSQRQVLLLAGSVRRARRRYQHGAAATAVQCDAGMTACLRTGQVARCAGLSRVRSTGKGKQ